MKSITLKLTRLFTSLKGTVGVLSTPAAHFSTIEDPLRPYGTKVYGDTCVPAGVYRLELTNSSHFGKLLPELLNVPNFKFVRIHSGNDKLDTEGCIVVGRTCDCWSYTVGKSREALKALMKELETAANNGIALYIDITDPKEAL